MLAIAYNHGTLAGVKIAMNECPGLKLLIHRDLGDNNSNQRSMSVCLAINLHANGRNYVHNTINGEHTKGWKDVLCV
ncbi:hypothetical protein PAXRUDRAFT_833916 [Paxillus rubicundulus Ve08.2h10]|uniref:Uncharacterized protein n=1 Tax=Paxillus rubicundulus Ve08.2h10 TaxID=930991 RepID=A0A0D0DMR6_9AGAM|nr:hypothetical protein PAXRUDRAFT_833916 [Paxillus rubicundulus Ve08.2h10]